MTKKEIGKLNVGDRLVLRGQLHVVAKMENGAARLTRVDDGVMQWVSYEMVVDALEMGEQWHQNDEGPEEPPSPLAVARDDLRHVLDMEHYFPGGATQEAIDHFLNSVCDLVSDYLARS